MMKIIQLLIGRRLFASCPTAHLFEQRGRSARLWWKTGTDVVLRRRICLHFSRTAGFAMANYILLALAYLCTSSWSIDVPCLRHFRDLGPI